MALQTFEVPTQEQIAEAIEVRNGALVAKYAVAVQYHRNQLADELPAKIEAASDAKRDLDVCKAAIKNCDETVKLLQSVLRQVRPV